MQLYKGQAPGPVKDERLAPRITETAKSLWLVYALISLAGIAALRICGMPWFDAICHAFSAVGLGGFSTHDRSVAYFGSPAIEAVLIVLMLIASLKLRAPLHRAAAPVTGELHGRPGVQGDIRAAGGERGRDRGAAHPQRGVCGFSTALRTRRSTWSPRPTTSGLTTQDYQRWPCSRPTGCCSCPASCAAPARTGGGIKMFRTLLLTRQAGRELTLLIHPAAIAPVRIGGRPSPTVWARGAGVHLPVFHDRGAAHLRHAAHRTRLRLLHERGHRLDQQHGTRLRPAGAVHNLHALTVQQTWICTARCCSKTGDLQRDRAVPAGVLAQVARLTAPKVSGALRLAVDVTLELLDLLLLRGDDRLHQSPIDTIPTTRPASTTAGGARACR